MSLEITLFVLLFICCVVATITDIMYGKIYNKIILVGGMFGIVINVIYLLQNNIYIVGFALNFLAASVLAIAFYVIKVWGAGDAKLWMLINLLFPFGVYYQKASDFAPGFRILILTFIVAYLFVLIETIILCVFKGEIYRIEKKPKNFSLKTFIRNWILSYCLIDIFYFILRCFASSIYQANRFYLAIIAVVILILCQKYLQKKEVAILTIVITIAMKILEVIVFNYKVQWQQVLITILVSVIALIIKEFASSFNYAWVKTSEVKSGMILSYTTILQFQRSRVQQLPLNTDETTKSRITVKEAEAIRRWQHSRYGQDEIMIVRHMPFAIFFVSGIVCYLLY